MQNTGQLYIVATPIGNLKDITLRALEILANVNLIAAEDTRYSKSLLQHYQITTPLISLHEHNEIQRCQMLIDRLKAGQHIALISDAGTPLISDPGYELVRSVREAQMPVIPIPGPCAAVAALSIAGLPTDHFRFDGFFPAKAAARRQCLETVKTEKRTVIFYESPHRILDTLEDIHCILGNERKIVIARELTKVFETVLTGAASTLITVLTADPYQQKGEFVVLIEGQTEPDSDISAENEKVLDILLAELPLKQAVQLAAKITGEKKNILYALGVEKMGNR